LSLSRLVWCSASQWWLMLAGVPSPICLSEVESSVSMLCLKFESVKSGVMFCKRISV
jgi:hypothetical protein